MTDYGVVLFHTTSAVMKTEKFLLGKGLTLKLIPTPRQFSTDCGISLRFEWDKKEIVESVLVSNRIENAGIFHLVQ